MVAISKQKLVLFLCIFTLLTVIFSHKPSYFQEMKWKKQRGGNSNRILPNFIKNTTSPPTAINECTTSKPNIMFFKTHKTASTAVQNILMRQALIKDWEVILPVNNHDFNYPGFFNEKSVIQFENVNKYNLLCHHMRYNDDTVSSIMPKNTSYYVSIVREPGSLFQSAFEYFWPIVPAFQRVNQNAINASESWLDNAEHYFKTSKKSPYSNFAKNPTFFDFGYDNLNKFEDYIAKSIAEIETNFDLVMVSDYFLESSVLLSHAMCWSLEEMACLTLNARNTDNSDIGKNKRISEKARKWNKADAAIFDYFNSTLWKKVKEYGIDRMAESVKRLEQINADITAYCIEGGKAVDSNGVKDKNLRSKIFKPKNVAVMGFNLREKVESNNTCKQLIVPENTFTIDVINWQSKKHKRVRKNLREVGRYFREMKKKITPFMP